MSSSPIEDKLEQLNLSNDEIKNIAEAFKKEEFRKLFAEYAQEISDPSNRAQYEKEITQLENERGMDIKFVKPTPGHVLKTTVNGITKAFINVCQNERVGKPSSQKTDSGNGKQGLSWSVPHLFSPPREDFTKDKQKCKVYDFVVHPDTYRLGESNVKFRKMINDMALEGVEKMFNVEVDQKNVKSLKMKYKGAVSSTVIRNKIPNADIKERNKDDLLDQFPYPYSTESSEEMAHKIQIENSEKKKQITDEKQTKTKMYTKEDKVKTENIEKEDKFTEPKYEIKYQSHVDYEDFIVRQDVTLSTRPRNLLLDIHLPLINSTAALTLDVFSERVYLVSHNPAKYKLDLVLPYKVNEDASTAKFDKTKHKLSLVLPVIAAELSKVSFINDEGMADEEEEEYNEEGVQCDIHGENYECEDVSKNEVEKNYELISSERIENVKENENMEKSSKKEDIVENKSLEESEINVFKNEKEVENGNIQKEYCNKKEENIFYEIVNDLKNEIVNEEMNKASETGPDSGIEDNIPNIEEASADKDRVGMKGEGDYTSCEQVLDPQQCESRKKLELESSVLEVNNDIKKVETQEAYKVEEVDEIVVVHEKECPNLQGILKSRTSSESSSLHESTDELSPQFPSSKKCVSFSDHVDETVYGINQSVSTLHATLKNRKKKKEKREAAKEKQEVRRRKNSGSVSSGDELCHLQHHTSKQSRPLNVKIDASKKVDSDDDAMDSEGVSSAADNDVCAVQKDKLLQQEEILKVRMTERKAAKDLEQKNVGRGIKRKSKKGKKFNGSEEKKEECQKSLVKEIDASDTQVTSNNSTASTIPHSMTPQPDTMLSWKESGDNKNAKCAIHLDNEQVFSLDLN